MSLDQATELVRQTLLMALIVAAPMLVIGLVVGVILIVGGLTFFPALALGPIVEQLAMNAGTLFSAN